MVTWLKWSWTNGPQKVIKQVEPEPNTMTTIVAETRRGSSMSTNGKTRRPIYRVREMYIRRRQKRAVKFTLRLATSTWT